MIKHIVLFKFDNPSADYLQNAVDLLHKLKNDIKEIISIEAGVNTNPNESFHLALSVLVEDYTALKTYATHPKHLEVGAIIRKKLMERSCVDFEA